MSKFKISVLLTALIFVLSSCEKKIPVDVVENLTPSTIRDSEESVVMESGEPKQMVLGEKLNNPFSVENMRIALDSLMNKSGELDEAGSNLRAAEAVDIYTTDLYVRFWANDSVYNNVLTQDTTLSLFPYPLDVEILEHGDYTDDEQTSDGKWYYTTVKPGYRHPAGLEYETLEELFIPENSEYYSEEDIEFSDDDEGNLRLASAQPMDNDLVNALIIQSFVNTGNENQLNLEKEESQGELRRAYQVCKTKRFLWWTWQSCDTYYDPDGYVFIKTPKGYQPVKGVKLRVWRWFYYADMFTNGNGYYRSYTQWGRNVIGNNMQYYIVFEGRNGCNNWCIDKTILTGLCLWTDKVNLGSYSPSGHNFYINSGNSAWGRCVISNAIYDYIDIARSEGITLPPRGLEIAASDVTRSKNFTSGAPLLKNHLNWSLSYANPFWGSLGSWVLYNLFAWGFPDLILKYSNSYDDYYRMVANVWHELTHCSHLQAMKNRLGLWTASDFWSKNIYQQVSNHFSSAGVSPYGEKGDKNWEVIALTEGWGYYREMRLCLQDFNRYFQDKCYLKTQYNEMFQNLSCIVDDKTIEYCLSMSTTLYELQEKLFIYRPAKASIIREIMVKYF